MRAISMVAELHGHRRDHFIPRELVFDVVAQDLAYRHDGALLRSAGPTLLWRCRPRLTQQRTATGSIDESTTASSGPGQVSAQEWQTRVDLAACYRLVDSTG